MSSSFKTELRCQFCAAKGVRESDQLVVNVDGKLVCTLCGWNLGKCFEESIPDEVGRVLLILLQECLFSVKERTRLFASSAPSAILLSSRCMDDFTATILWTPLSYAQQVEYGRATPTFYTPKADAEHLPAEVEQTMRVLTERKFEVAELKQRGKAHSYARFARNFGDEKKGPPMMVYGNPADIPMPPVLRVIVELTWSVPSSQR